MSDAPLLEATGLTRRFGQFVAVKDLSFEVGRGEIFGFLGSNGAGKSTTIRMLCGLLRPSSGTALVGGIDVSADPEGVKQRMNEEGLDASQDMWEYYLSDQSTDPATWRTLVVWPVL